MNIETTFYDQFKLLTYNLPFVVKLMKGERDIESCFTQITRCQHSDIYYSRIFYDGSDREMIELGSYNLNDLYHSTKCVIEILKRKSQIYSIIKTDVDEQYTKIVELMTMNGINKMTSTEDIIYEYMIKGKHTDIIRRIISSKSLFSINQLNSEIKGLVNELNGYNVSFVEKKYFRNILVRPFYLNFAT